MVWDVCSEPSVACLISNIWGALNVLVYSHSLIDAAEGSVSFETLVEWSMAFVILAISSICVEEKARGEVLYIFYTGGARLLTDTDSSCSCGPLGPASLPKS